MELNKYSFLFRGEEKYLNVLFYSNNIIRFAYSDGEAVPPSTAAINVEPLEVKPHLEEGCIRGGNLAVEIDRQTLKVKIYDLAGELLSEDLKVMAERPGLEKKLLREMGIYGNGEKYTWLNQLGGKTANFNSDVLLHHGIHHPMVEEMHTAIPFYIGAAPGLAYGIFFDNSYRTEFDFAKSDPGVISFRASGGRLDYYFIFGPSIDQVVGNYGWLTGTTPLPRRKFLGYQQSRYSYRDQDELLSVAENLRRYQIPCDVLYLDIDYMEGYKVFTVSSERFRDFKKVLKELKHMGFAVVVIIDPGVKVEDGYRVYEEGRQKGYFVTTPSGEIYEGAVWPSPAVFPDFLRSEVRQWWGGFHQELLELGVEGIWNDMNEPSNFALVSGTLPEDAVHLSEQGEPLNHAEGHNLYGMQQVRATREALEKYRPEQRPFILTRAAFAGSQRYAALWTGDNSSLWEHLECSVPMILNLGLSGYSFVGADVGGFRGDCSGELLVRWTQLGAFMPFFRNHSETGTARQEPWVFSPEVLDLTRRYIRLRYRFLTYIYNLMRESHLRGTPVVRPLFYHFHDDPNTYNINDQFLLGEGVMVCPVLRPRTGHRQVYLPEGLWFDYWSGQTIRGGRYLVCEAPLDKLPLFVRAGTILPQDEYADSEQSGEVQAPLVMHCYAGKEGCYRLYIDDGSSYRYRSGCYSELEFAMSADPMQPEVKVKKIKEGFPLPEISFKTFRVS